MATAIASVVDLSVLLPKDIIRSSRIRLAYGPNQGRRAAQRYGPKTTLLTTPEGTPPGLT